jgi:RNA polymerase sigma factor (sigma-70 family)
MTTMHDTPTQTTGSWDALSDADLTERIRGGRSSVVEAALDELYRRHRTSVLMYARTCTRDSHTAEDLTSEAFARVLSAVRGGAGPREAWRPYLLTTVRRTAAAWAATARRIELAPDFESWLSEGPVAESGEERMLLREDRDLVLRAFRRLPERWQTALWHSVVEEEPPQRIAVLLGISASGVTSLTARAREGLREAYLVEYAMDVESSEACRHFTGRLAVMVRREGGLRMPRSLGRHLDECRGCRRAGRRMRELNTSLAVMLPVAVLLWAGGSYGTKAAAAAGAGGAAASQASGTMESVGSGVAPATLVKAGGVAIVMVAAILGGYAFQSDDGRPSKSAPAPASFPAPSATAVVPVGRTEAPLPIEPPTRAPSTVPTPPATRVSRSSAPPSSRPPANDRTRLAIMSTGRCMDISAAEGAQPYEAQCGDSRSQQWELLVDRPAQEVRIRNLETGMCLSSSGSSTDGAPVRQQRSACTSAANTARWVYFRKSAGEVSFAQKDNTLYVLGLNEWNAAAGRHSSAIGTTTNYYDSESFRFRYSGDPFPP